MRELQGIGAGLLTTAAIAIVAQTPAFAQTKVQDVRLVEMNGEVGLVLVTNAGERPEVFVVRRGNDFVADIINTQLPAQKQNFQQNNPIPGIASVVVTQLDPTSVRVIVSGVNSPPDARILQGGREGIVITMGSASGAVAQAPAQPVTPPAPPPSANPNPQQPPARSPQPVLVPDPQITIDGRNLPQSGIRPSDAAPPFLPRAVAPPVGDIAVSNINPTTTSAIRLDNAAQRIPRLVLRDAPVLDVLALLARTAGLNIAFLDGASEQSGQASQGATATGNGQKISLDIENESVEDVFNHVLRLSGLEANRTGNTVFIGSRLPNSVRNVVVRSLRLNQVDSRVAANFLASMGAESAVTRVTQKTTVESVKVPNTDDQSITTTETTLDTSVDTLRIESKDSTPLLRGLQVLADERLNTITLVGPPSLVELASSQLIQLDLRQRQVAVNVKVIDMNLTGTDAASSSFSFGVNDTFFVNDGGAASVNFGGYNPANRDTATSGINARPIIRNRTNDDQNLSGQAPFYDRNGLAVNPLTAPGGGVSLDPIAPVTERPGQVGVSDYTPFTRDLATGALTALGSTTNSIFPFFQYPRKFLSTLTAQIISGNAKILTDPTLVVQEGEKASVALVENIVKAVNVTTISNTGGVQTNSDPKFEDVGLKLGVNIERIDDNGFVTLIVTPEISAIGDRVEISNNGAFATETFVRTLNSGRVRLRDGQTLILSGIIQERERVNASKIPLLGDLPIVGSLFRRTTKENTRAEVIVLVTPQILDDSDRSPYGYQYNPSPDALRMMQGR